MTKLLGGLAMMLLGIVVGLYVGGYVMFFGGLVDAINAAKATPVEAIMLAKGVCKVVFAGFVGWVSGLLLLLPGYALVISAK